MGENSNIEWTDHTFNPWIGCQTVSPGCDHCYAETWDSRGLQQRETRWGPHAVRTRTSAANWRKPLAWNRAAEKAGKRARVFCASLADVFDNHASILPEWRFDLWELIYRTPSLDWLLLTKRPQNIKKYLPDGWLEFSQGKGWHNVWVGTSVEDQATADARIPHLLATPAAVRFVSAEPLTGPVDLTSIERRCGTGLMRPLDGRFRTIDWVICGGESGPGARPMHPDWARSLRDQCQAAGVAFFFKQWGEWSPCILQADEDGEPSAAYAMEGCCDSSAHDYQQQARFWLPEGTLGYWTDVEQTPAIGARRVGKKAAGRLLDGVTWDNMPGGGGHE
jgi:protein gp37